MRKFTFLAVMFCLFGLSNIANAQIVNIPDANFKAKLVAKASINTNGDGEIQVSEAAAFTGYIYVASSSISDLTGIEAFTALTILNCEYNELTSLDLSANYALTELTCFNNQLTSLNISANTALTKLSCFSNQLTSLDVSANTALSWLYCYNNQLTSLNLSADTALTILNCYSNQITSLNLSTNTALIYLNCENNQLTSLDVKNGNNTNITGFYAEYNPSLTCIQVDDVSYSNYHWSSFKDATASFYEDCSTSSCIVNIPNANFKSALLENTNINTNGDSEIQCSEAAAFSGAININQSSISNLTGIEAFTALTVLYCSNNQLTSLNLSSNTALTYLGCANNQLTNIDLSANTALTTFYGSSNQLTSLDISANTALTNLWCNFNNISSLNLSTNTALSILSCSNNYLTSLDISANTALTELDCGYNQLTSLNASANTALTGLTCTYNELTSFYIPSTTTLTFLDCAFNNLTSLDLSYNTALDYLFCAFNQLTSLNLSANTVLTTFYGSSNQFTSLNFSANTNLTKLSCVENQLTSLDIKNGNNINFIEFSAEFNPNLSCIQVDDTTFMNNNWASGIDATASFSEICIPTAPTNLTVNSLKKILANMILSWTDNSNNEDGFRIYRSTDDANFSEIGTTSANVNTYIDSTVAASTLYYYRVTAYNSAGSSTFSNTTSGTTTDINEISENNTVSVYPNPTTGKLAVSLSTGNIGTIEIYNLTGEKVYENSFNQQKSIEIDISKSPCGIYFLKISNGVQVYTSKIVVQ